MENRIFKFKSTYWKSLMIREDELWLSQNNVSSVEKFEKALQKTGIMKSAYAYPLSSVQEVSFNEASDTVKIKYLNEDGKQKKVTADFGERTTSNQLGHALGTKLNLSKTEKQEQQWKPLLSNLLYLVLTIGGTYFLTTLADTEELGDGSSNRNRRRIAFLKMIVDTIGQTGVIIIGSVIALVLVYQLYKRFNNPAKEVLYSLS